MRDHTHASALLKSKTGVAEDAKNVDHATAESTETRGNDIRKPGRAQKRRDLRTTLSTLASSLRFADVAGQKKSFFLAAAAVTIIIIAISNCFPALFDAFLACPIVLVCVIGIGIPHGALDNLIFYGLIEDPAAASGSSQHALIAHGERQESDDTLVSEEDASENASTVANAAVAVIPTRHRIAFYLSYLSVMACWVAMWCLAPVATFWLFMACSAFHFGQGELHYMAAHTIFPPLLFMSRGLLLLGCLVTSRPAVTLPIITTMIRETPSFLASPTATSTLKIASVSQHLLYLTFQLLMALPLTTATTQRLRVSMSWILEIARSILMAALFLGVDPLVGFAVYFGIWHAASSILDQMHFLRLRNPAGIFNNDSLGKVSQSIEIRDVVRYFWLAAPFATLAFLGMVLLAAIASHAGLSLDSVTLWACFVVGVSVITGPHIWVMEGFYAKRKVLA